MINSKAIKGLPRRAALDLKKNRESFLGNLADKISYGFKMYLYYPVDSFFSRTYERVSRSLAFAKHGYMHYDFESAYIYDLMAFKMKRVYECLQDGHAIQDDVDMKALKEAIKICERLFRGNYDSKYHALHNKKWGNLKSRHVPIEWDKKGDPTMYQWMTSRSKANTPKQQEAERKAFMQTWEDGEKDRLADLDRLNVILKNHEPKWWD